MARINPTTLPGLPRHSPATGPVAAQPLAARPSAGQSPGLAVHSHNGVRFDATILRFTGHHEREGMTIARGVFQPAGPFTLQVYSRTSDGRVHDDSFGAFTGETAACGSAATAAMLARFGRFATTEGIDASMRVTPKLGGSLLASVDYLRSQGLGARFYAGGTVDDLEAALAAGLGVIVTYSDAVGPHTVVVTGAFTNDHGERYVQVQDWHGDHLVVIERESFEASWAQVRLGGLGGLKTGIGGAFILVAAPGVALPSAGDSLGTLGAQSSLTVLDGFHALTTGAVRLVDEDPLGGAARVVAGAVQLVVQSAPTCVVAVGAGLEWLGRRMLRPMTRVWPAGPLMARLGAATVAIAALPLLACGWLVGTLGVLLGAMTAALARGLARPFIALSDWVHDDNDAANQALVCDSAGSARERRNWEQLVETSVEEKARLAARLLTGVISQRDERAVDRVFDAAREAGQTATLATLLGSQRLSATGLDAAEQDVGNGPTPRSAEGTPAPAMRVRAVATDSDGQGAPPTLAGLRRPVVRATNPTMGTAGRAMRNFAPTS